jgi:hypothetical protein
MPIRIVHYIIRSVAVLLCAHVTLIGICKGQNLDPANGLPLKCPRLLYQSQCKF